MNRSELDLSQLAMDRGTPPAADLTQRRRSFLLRYVLPFALLAGFVCLLGFAVGTRFLPYQSVQVVPVIVKRSSVQPSGTPLFQAAGWIEPRPTAINVAALAPGVIEELMVVEGQAVKKSDPIARLVAIDTQIAADRATAALASAEADLKRALAANKAAKIRLHNPVHLKVTMADALALLAKSQTALSQLPFLIESAEANLEFARQSYEGKKAAGTAVSGVSLQKAHSLFTAADAEVRELRQRRPHLEGERNALQAKVDALTIQLELLVDENRLFNETEAKVDSAKAFRDQAKSTLQLARLMLERTVVRAPMSGNILRLTAAPGTRVMGLKAVAGQSSSTVAQMYDPKRLQVRADVRLENVPLVQPGQLVEIETASSKGVLHGRVLQSNSTANIQKNTLEVKVELIDPPDAVRPEMLVTATFLVPKMEEEDSSELLQKQRIFVPKPLVQSDSQGSFVWIVDSDQLAAKRWITVGKGNGEALIEAIEGLNITDKVIATGLETLRPGTRVVVTGEERSLGVK